jgi:hypothetical protein
MPAIEDAGWFWDHADQRHLIAHDYLIANYVCASLKHYTLEFRRFRKKDICVAEGTPSETPQESAARSEIAGAATRIRVICHPISFNAPSWGQYV